MMAIETLFDVEPLITPEPVKRATIDERYAAWIALNPWVLDAMERLVSDWLDAGHKRVGVKQMWEVIRHQYGRTTGDTFKANNDYTSRVARSLLQRHPEWADAIETRGLRAA